MARIIDRRPFPTLTKVSLFLLFYLVDCCHHVEGFLGGSIGSAAPQNNSILITGGGSNRNSRQRQQHLVNTRPPAPITSSSSSGRGIVSVFAIQDATFGMGCFWKPSEELLKRDGVVETIVGYTGHPAYSAAGGGGAAGASSSRTATPPPPPTYDDVCFGRNWVEAVRVRYDDTMISYSQLLDAFFECQEPRWGSRQYASIIFPHTPAQDEIAREWWHRNRDRVRSSDGVAVAAMTTIEARSPFYMAEQYHQRYWQKMRPRFAAAAVLLTIGSGIADPLLTSAAVQHAVHATANGLVLVGMLAMVLERKFDTKTVEL
jgi:peptide-methionine (S)-S-oxide reductase